LTRSFVTGGSGFIGGALVSRLVDRGDEVVALARSADAAAALAGRGASVAHGHVLDEAALRAGMAGCDRAFHVAGVNTHCPSDPAELLRVNVEGTANAVRAAAAAGVRRLVLTSSAASLGEAPGTVGDEDTTHRGTYLSVYERSKREGEDAAFAAGRDLGLDVVAVNPSSVQGPGRSSGNGKIVIDYLNGRLKAFVDTYISVVDIDDCVEGHVLAAERGGPARGTCSTGRRSPPTRPWRCSSSCPRSARTCGCSRPRSCAPRPRWPRRPTAPGAGRPRCAGRGCGRSCTATATTARARRVSSGWRTRPWPRRSGARSSGRRPPGSCGRAP
jgi:dihydroflavonol-4-reductase